MDAAKRNPVQKVRQDAMTFLMHRDAFGGLCMSDAFDLVLSDPSSDDWFANACSVKDEGFDIEALLRAAFPCIYGCPYAESSSYDVCGQYVSAPPVEETASPTEAPEKEAPATVPTAAPTAAPAEDSAGASYGLAAFNVVMMTVAMMLFVH